jgi:hypothetical protein
VPGRRKSSGETTTLGARAAENADFHAANVLALPECELLGPGSLGRPP